MLDFRMCRGSTTGEMVKQALLDAGAQIGPTGQGVVSYGVRVQDARPTLNALAGRLNKLEEKQCMAQAGLLVVPHYGAGEIQAALQGLHYPVLGRKLKHTMGKDILVLPDADKLQECLAAKKRAYFTPLIDEITEYRVWVFRGRAYATYEKVLRYPEWRKRPVGRNYHNGYAFEFRGKDVAPKDVRALARAAMAARMLDFGAIDILVGKDGRNYLLEINTAPAAEAPTRQCIKGLVANILRWEQEGYPGA